MGLSLVAPTHEACYLRAGGLRLGVAASAARFTLDVGVKILQVPCRRQTER